MARMPNFVAKAISNLISKHRGKFNRRFLLLILIVILFILGYNYITNEQNQKRNTERYARELEHCKQIRTVGERYKWSGGGTKGIVKVIERYDASSAAKAQEWEDFILGRCASQRMSKGEASEFETTRELERILEDVKADRIRFCSSLYGTQVALESRDYNLYETRVRNCLGEYGIQY